MMAGLYTGLGKILDRISESQLKRAQVSMNISRINYCFMKNVQNL